MAFAPDKLWICIFEFAGVPHVQVARSSASRETVLIHLQAEHADKKILELREAKDIQDVEDVAQRIREDPDWRPIDPGEMTLKESELVAPQV